MSGRRTDPTYTASEKALILLSLVVIAALLACVTAATLWGRS